MTVFDTCGICGRTPEVDHQDLCFRCWCGVHNYTPFVDWNGGEATR